MSRNLLEKNYGDKSGDISKENEIVCPKNTNNLHRRKPSPLSDLKSLMEAEQELNSILSRKKDFRKLNVKNEEQNVLNFFSPDNSYSTTCWSSSEKFGENIREENLDESGFSKFAHFRPPIKRP